MKTIKPSGLRFALVALVAFIFGFGIADNLKKVISSPVLRFSDAHAIDEYLRNHSVRKLQLGAGGNSAKGWLNTDIKPADNQVYLDATAKFPLPDGSFQYAFNEHLIEHLPWELGLFMLRESYRVLAQGGKIRIITPNLTKFLKLLDDSTDADAQLFIEAKFRQGGYAVNAVPGIYILNRQMREWGHQFLYDPPTLRKSLEMVGFKQITQYEITKITDPVFQEVELRSRHSQPLFKLINNWEAMAFEAVR